MQSHINNGTLVRATTAKPLSVLASGIGGYLRKHYVISSLYFIGLFVALLGTGFTVTDDQRATYETRVSEAVSLTASELSRLNRELHRNEQLYYENKGWFSCDEKCMKYYNRCESIRLQLNDVKVERDKVLLEGKQAVGVWSVYGVNDLRNAFWQAWEDGKEAARRMTMLDAVFIGLGSMTGHSSDRENSFIITLARILFQFMANLTVGLFTSFVVFVFEAWYIISSYGPSMLSGLTLFLLTFAASASLVTTAIGGIVGGTVGAVYWLAHNAERQAVEGSRHRRLHYD
jgi:hypothetical protein